MPADGTGKAGAKQELDFALGGIADLLGHSLT
jgi:hypothetical protein